MYKNSGFEAQLRLKSVTGETGPKSKAENCTNKFRQNINMSTQWYPYQHITPNMFFYMFFYM